MTRLFLYTRTTVNILLNLDRIFANSLLILFLSASLDLPTVIIQMTLVAGGTYCILTVPDVRDEDRQASH